MAIDIKTKKAHENVSIEHQRSEKIGEVLDKLVEMNKKGELVSLAISGQMEDNRTLSVLVLDFSKDTLNPFTVLGACEYTASNIKRIIEQHATLDK